MIDLDLSEPPNALPREPFGNSAASLDIPLNVPGIHHGHLSLAYAEASRGPAQLILPVCIVHGQHAGPTVTFIAGIHGDEPEGTLTLLSLAQELDYQKLNGTVFVLPSLSISALQQRERLCPEDNKNMDISFPGNPMGTIAERLAHEVMERFIKPAELIIDLRSGGRQLVFDTCAAVRFSPDKEHQQRCEGTMIAFGAPNSARLPASDPKHSLQGAVSSMGKCYLQSELGGGADCSLQTLDIARKGCRNVLRHWNMLDDDIELSSTRLLEVRDDSYYIYAIDSGLLEPCAHLGHPVWKDDTIAKIRNPQRTEQAAQLVATARNAILLAAHPGGWVESGDLIAVLGEEVQG